MGFFVEKNLEENQSQNKNRETDEKLHLMIIAMSKKMSMSFEELNQFRVKDFLETFNIFIGKNETEKTQSKNNKTISSPKEVEDFLLGR